MEKDWVRRGVYPVGGLCFGEKLRRGWDFGTEMYS